MTTSHVSDFARKSTPAPSHITAPPRWGHSAAWAPHPHPIPAPARANWQSTSNSFGHDFGKVRINAESPRRESTSDPGLLTFQTPPTTTPTATPTATPAATPTVDRIDIVDSPTGAIGGYPAITSGDLNVPGPFNNAATGAVNNVHQMHFHLDRGNSSQLTPNRIVRGSNWLAGVEIKHPADQVLPPGALGPPAPGGFGGVMDAPDGPAAHEIQRPSADKIVIADAPGIGGLAASHYPYIHKSTFSLTVSDSSGTAVARLRYGVRIEKKNAGDIPNTENRVFSIAKEDLVHGRSLP